MSDMNNIDNDDPLISNEFISDLNQSAGYGMTAELRRHKLREHINKQHITLDSTDPQGEQELLDTDMLKTNPVITDEGKLKDMNYGRRVKEVKTVLNINSIQRQELDTRSNVVEKNPETGLYTREVTDDEGNTVVQLYNADILNDEFEPGPNDVHRPYLRRPDGHIVKTVYKYRDPNEYIIRFGRTFTNVKSVRLLSVEIPNTLNAVNQYNNIILLDIYDNDTGSSVSINDTDFGFLLIQLTPGSYTLSELSDHIQDTVNEYIKEHTFDIIIDLFTVTINEITGKVSIKLNNPPGRDLKFHWRWWFANELNGELPITKFSNLWYLLGFPTAYETNTDGSDKYTTEYTNLFDFGINEQLEGKVPDEKKYHIIKPYRFPDILPNKYIYLEIKNMGALIDARNPDVTNFKSDDLFAKIIYDVPPGEISHKFVSNPKLYDHPLTILERLDIRWVDYAGLPVDFQLRNHSFTLEIIEYIDVLESTGYDARRGTIDTTSYPDIVKFGGH